MRDMALLIINVSILAPAQGASPLKVIMACNAIVSILAPAQGASKLILDSFQLHLVSILAPAQGASLIFDMLYT